MSIENYWRQIGGMAMAAVFFSFIFTAASPAEVPTKSAPAATALPDPRVKPGASITLEFPSLPKMRNGDTSKMMVRIPAKYDPNRLYPLIGWMYGAAGNYKPGYSFDMVDKDSFICIGMPFPIGCNNPEYPPMVGNFPEIWKYHKAMLDELRRVVPNISPSLRILGGFSNGGHTLTSYLGMKDPDLMNWFNTYVVVEAVDWGGDYGHLAGRYICVAWGEDSRAKPCCIGIANKAEGAKMKVKRVPQPKIGHDFCPEAKKSVNEWLKEVVIADMLSQALAAMEKDKQGGYLAGKGMEVLAEGTKDEAKFKEMLAKLEEGAKKEFEAIKARAGKNPADPARKDSIESLRGFLKKYCYSRPAVECETMLAGFGQEDLAKLMASLPADSKPANRQAAVIKLLQFAREWEGLAPARDALKTVDNYSDHAFQELKTTIPDKPNAQQRPGAAGNLRKFAADWPATSGAKAAMAMLCELAEGELAELQAKMPADMNPEQKRAAVNELRTAQKKWEGTPASGTFQKAINDIEHPKKNG